MKFDSGRERVRRMIGIFLVLARQLGPLTRAVFSGSGNRALVTVFTYTIQHKWRSVLLF